MQSQNKKDQRQMELEDKDINIIFKPQIGLGKILFSFQEEDIITLLGIPEEKEIDVFNDLEYAIHLYYHRFKIYPSIYYENNKFDYLSISTEDLILDNIKFSTLKKKEILKFIEDYHKSHEIVFSMEKEYDKIVNEYFYNYENIGLSIWFEDSLISDICVQKIRTAETNDEKDAINT